MGPDELSDKELRRGGENSGLRESAGTVFVHS